MISKEMEKNVEGAIATKRPRTEENEMKCAVLSSLQANNFFLVLLSFA